MMMPLLPMLEFLHPRGVVIDGCQDFQHRHEVALGKELLHRSGIAFLLRRGAESKTDFLESDMGIFSVQDVCIRGQVLLVQCHVQLREHLVRVDEGL
jgi:hypothetical protein